MPRRSWTHRWFILLLLASLLSPGRAFAAAPDQASAGRTVLVDQGDQAGLAWLAAAGAEKLVDYGAFSLWRAPGAAPAGAGGIQALQAGAPPLRSAGSRVFLRGLTLQTDQPKVEPLLPPGLIQQAAAGPRFWMVQFAGPVLPDWLKQLQTAGLEIVAYLPENAYVVWGDSPAQRLAGASGLNGLIAWQGAYQPFYRLHPDLRPGVKSNSAGSTLDVTVQLYDTPAVDDSAGRLEALADSVLGGPERVLNLTNLRLRLPAGQLDAIANWADVFNVEPYSPPVRMDEVQGQILAGNLTSSAGSVVPSGPGYLAWLASKGFPTDPAAYPIVDVVDDGIDQGDALHVLHPDFHELGVATDPARVMYIANCTSDLNGNSTGGHGNINAGIVAGYNNGIGGPFQDTSGYRIGLGISPYGRVAGTKIFQNSGPYDVSRCGGSHILLVSAAYANGARITSNSWGDSFAHGGYDTMAQEYDVLTRDADANPANGNQEMLHVFAAGNDGRVGLNTIGSPGTAKDVITVGASESVRDNGVYCRGITAADNADDMADFSSRGPAADGRAKPDLTAPGTHIQGPASQDPGYDGSVVCGLYYPLTNPQQTLYTWSSGTSHSTPAVSGAAQLATVYYYNVLSPGNNPSPAMLKALLLNSTRYMAGLAANDTLPGVAQGWGMADLGTLFDGAPRLLLDETTLLTASGQTYNLLGTVSDPAKPFRVTLTWTDAPGSTVGPAQVNDLDLEVTANGTVYHGNVFAGAGSVPGGTADSLNNVESVFLPAGVSGGFSVRVVARNVAGDGVPGNATLTDQDFALVVDNASASLSPVLMATGVRWSEDIGNGNGFIEPGETAFVDVDLQDLAGAPAALAPSAAVSVAGGQATVLQGVSGYPDILPGSTATNLVRFRVQVLANQPCGGDLTLGFQIAYVGGAAGLSLPALSTSPPAFTSAYSYAGPAVNIPDGNANGVLLPLQVNDATSIHGLTVTLDITHPYVGDLVLSLVAPGGQTVLLANRRGGAGDNYSHVTFDDLAAQSIAASPPPFTGSYRPEEPLAGFNLMATYGIWKLKAVDNAAFDLGAVNSYSLSFQIKICAPMVWPYKYYLPLFDNR